MNIYKLLQWQLHAKSIRYKKHLKFAKNIIHKAHAIGQFIISWSAGKDSTAMTHLIKSLYPETPIMIQCDDCDWPEKRPYVERIAQKQKWEYHLIEPDFSVWERAKQLYLGIENICSQSHSLTQEAFLVLLEEKREELQCIGSYIGLRAQESNIRKYHLGQRTELYQLRSGEWHCCPLGRWTVEDVFAYHVEHDIEVNPCYLHNRFKQPEEIRLSWALPTPFGFSHGISEHLRFYYPEQYRRLRELGGDLRHAF